MQAQKMSFFWVENYFSDILQVSRGHISISNKENEIFFNNFEKLKQINFLLQFVIFCVYEATKWCEKQLGDEFQNYALISRMFLQIKTNRIVTIDDAIYSLKEIL